MALDYQPYAAQLLTDPTPSSVVDIDQGGDVEAFAVEVLIPTYADSILGEFILGTSRLGGLSWYGLSDRWTGLSVDEGSDDDNLTVGTATFTFNAEAGGTSLVPWSPDFPNGANLYAGPGTLIRAMYRVDGTWYALFTGLVESWDPTSAALSKLWTVTITASQTLAQLAGVNGAGVAASFAGDLTPARVERLLADALWPYGIADDAPGPTMTSAAVVTHQATTMSGNRLAEIDLTCRSHPEPDAAANNCTVASWRVASSRRGQFVYGPLGGMAHETPHGVTALVVDEATDIDGDTLATANDADLRVNEVALAAAGGTTWTYRNDLSVGRSVLRSEAFLQWNCEEGTVLDPVADEFLNVGDVTLRPREFQLHIATVPHIASFVPWARIATLTAVDGLEFVGYRVARVHHELTPRGASGLVWRATVTVRPTFESSTIYP